MSAEQHHPERRPIQSVEFPVQTGPTIVLEQQPNGSVQLSWDTALSAVDFLGTLQQLHFEEGEEPDVCISTSIKHDDQQRLPLRLKLLVLSFSELRDFRTPTDAEDIRAYTATEVLTWKRTTTKQGYATSLGISPTPDRGLPFSFLYAQTTGIELPSELITEIMHHPSFQQR